MILLYGITVFTISDHIPKSYGLNSEKLIIDCYTSVTRDFTLTSIWYDFVKGSTQCSDTIAQINKTGIFLGTPIETVQCPGTNYFCCAKKNQMNQLISIYCQNVPGN